MLCLQEIAALILHKNEREREHTGVYLDENIFFLLAFELCCIETFRAMCMCEMGM